MKVITKLYTVDGSVFISAAVEVTDDEYAAAVESTKQILGASGYDGQISIETADGGTVVCRFTHIVAVQVAPVMEIKA